ncbi:MAG: RNA-guided pseudouridylation complex pseudouridine synthase subunit Cbf5 [Candidatus Nanohaloarchaea archaeon]|nr:RNA-guided pseudouridylation complex pseudouridine synthase subunit Cbf5 [Candidatus Nanohaloarchaea archaeon]
MLPGEERQDEDWRVRQEAETDWEYGGRPEQRPLDEMLDNGIVLVDKPAGPTSHQVSMWTKEVLEREKTGHSGTLDPGVTGALPIGLNRGTKILQALTQAGKEYLGVMRLEEDIDRETIETTAADFVGTNTQVPPEKSAVKREEREREVYELTVLEVDGKDVLFRIECEKGFYVRVFCRQFGKALDTTGKMTELRRTKVGVFQEDRLHTLQELVDAYELWKQGEEEEHLREMVLPVEAGVRHLRKIMVKDSAVASICHGANLGTAGITRFQDGIREGEMIALLTMKGELIALADAEMGADAMAEEDGTAADLRRVFMQKDVYPKAWTQS